jgi:hypothetical protein
LQQVQGCNSACLTDEDAPVWFNKDSSCLTQVHGAVQAR